MNMSLFILICGVVFTLIMFVESYFEAKRFRKVFGFGFKLRDSARQSKRAAMFDVILKIREQKSYFTDEVQRLGVKIEKTSAMKDSDMGRLAVAEIVRMGHSVAPAFRLVAGCQ